MEGGWKGVGRGLEGGGVGRGWGWKNFVSENARKGNGVNGKIEEFLPHIPRRIQMKITPLPSGKRRIPGEFLPRAPFGVVKKSESKIAPLIPKKLNEVAILKAQIAEMKLETKKQGERSDDMKSEIKEQAEKTDGRITRILAILSSKPTGDEFLQ